MTDLLLTRYHSLSYILSLDYEEAFSLIQFAYKQREEELLFQRWMHEGHSMHMDFDKFKEEVKPKKKQTAKETLNEVEDILTNFERGDYHRNI